MKLCYVCTEGLFPQVAGPVIGVDLTINGICIAGSIKENIQGCQSQLKSTARDAQTQSNLGMHHSPNIAMVWVLMCFYVTIS